jgi:protein-S-isoprenylcysteine O-methyltransferase Ste14
MRKTSAVIGTVLWFVLAPGVAAVLVPWWLTRWRVEDPTPYWAPLRLLGIVLVIAGTAVLVHAFARFALEGLGTPAPVAPPQHLVVGGLYRYVRNPMYLAAIAILVGQALIFGQPVLLAYALIAVVAVVAFVHWYEEPTLRRKFGEQYEVYRRAVPGWWPRLRPRRPGERR